MSDPGLALATHMTCVKRVTNVGPHTYQNVYNRIRFTIGISFLNAAPDAK